MAGPRVTRGGQLAAELTAAGVPATHDVQRLAAMLPAVLVGPPRLAFDVGDGATATWRLLAVASTPDALRAWEQLDALLGPVSELLPIETAEPVSFAPDPSSDPLPAYALTFTEYVD
jgi:hypothetical protein